METSVKSVEQYYFSNEWIPDDYRSELRADRPCAMCRPSLQHRHIQDLVCIFIVVNCVQQTFHDCSSDLTDKLTTSCAKNRLFWKISSERMWEIFPPFSYSTLFASFQPFLFGRYSIIVKYLFRDFCVKCNMRNK